MGGGSGRKARPHMTGPCCDLKEEGRKKAGHTALAIGIPGNLSEVWTGLWMGLVSPAGFGLETSSGHCPEVTLSGGAGQTYALPSRNLAALLLWFARTLSKSDSALSSCF